jgi:hypothetical protein
VVSHIRAYEKSESELSFRQHVGGLTRKTVYAAFASGLFYFIVVEWDISVPVACVISGIVGMHAAEVLDFLFETLKTAIAARLQKDGNKP